MSSSETDYLLSLFNTKAELPFFAPLPQVDAPPPDTFDTEFEGFEFEGTVQLPTFEDPFSTFRGNTPVFTSPSVFTHSTESNHDLTASEYSYGYPASNYSMPLDLAFHNVRVSSEYGGVDPLHDSMYPSTFNDLPSFGPLPSPSPSPPLRLARAQSDYGPSNSRQPHFGISPDNLSLPRQQPPPSTVPAVLPVQASDKQTHTGPGGRAHQCPNCNRAFARAFNLKTHLDTHNPERVKQYVCPHTGCKRPFSRKHDLQRHRTAIHRDQASSSSVYSDSSRISKPAVGVTTGSRVWCDKCGKSRVGRECEGGCDCNDVK
ncbi:hypothetical protein F5148DRAFT_1160483 [Russula earlei]|uniref:Uncharacterized protein n=1 Tax=Russula earlei TaxID=71964 RepID=A0ACC0UMC0_9AGAM|nr:hypothetical protein F5148DRAFT_1160483 [Russula earlei]